MTKESTMTRAAADVAAGDVGTARRRLASLQQSFPPDFDIRRALRDACRAGHDPAEAGRWGFVLDGTTADEIAAFRRRCGDHPRQMLLEVKWPVGAPAESDEATARITDLRTRFAALPAPVRHGAEISASYSMTLGERIVGAAFALAAGGTVMLLGLGAYQTMQIVRGWFG